MSDLTDKLQELLAFDEESARQHSYDLDELNKLNPDYYNDTCSIIEGARWKLERLQPLHAKLLKCVEALERYKGILWRDENGLLQHSAGQALAELRKECGE